MVKIKENYHLYGIWLYENTTLHLKPKKKQLLPLRRNDFCFLSQELDHLNVIKYTPGSNLSKNRQNVNSATTKDEICRNRKSVDAHAQYDSNDYLFQSEAHFDL